jgi:hypothetical protein
VLAIRLVDRVAGAAERSNAVASDVFLTNKLPSILSRLRIDVDDIRAQNADI